MRKGTLKNDAGEFSGELQRIGENESVRARFVELMNAALIPIADYYRIQQRILEDQQVGLDSAQGVMDAIHGTVDPIENE